MAEKRIEKLSYVSLPTVLVCAPSGTGLTGAGERLRSGADVSTLVFDLEKDLCENIDDPRVTINPGKDHPDMRAVLYLPRRRVLQEWDAACSRILSMSPGSATLRAIFLHLTWYSADTSEFFSPINPLPLARAGDVRHVILLIDDIYDMYVRLQKPNDLYDDLNIDRDADLLEKLRPFSPLDDESGYPLEEQKRVHRSRRRHEAVEMALMQLISWRRAEMIQAENLARTLGAEFTLLGTKHSWESFRFVVERPTTRRTYLSHRISEVRRKNKASNELPARLGEWDPVVHEVNDLHLEFLKHKQLLINPTAIDELRFDDLEPHRPVSHHQEPTVGISPLLSRAQSPLLARRWPLPTTAAMLWTRSGEHSLQEAYSEELESDDRAAQHTGLLRGELELRDPISSAVARSLSAQIYFDIAARDHMIVEHTPGLCVYRPFFSTDHSGDGKSADWSKGVEREIDHWRKKQPGSVEPKAAFVHTRAEIVARLQWLEREERLRKFVAGPTERLLRKKLGDWDISPEEIEQFFEGVTTRQGVQLGRRPEQAIFNRAHQVLSWIEAYALICLRHMFTRLDNPDTLDGDSETDPNVGLFTAEEAGDQSVVGLEELAISLCGFFGGGDLGEQSSDQSDEDTEKPGDGFWDVHEKAFAEVFGPGELSDVLRREVSDLTVKQVSAVIFDGVPDVGPEILYGKVSELPFSEVAELFRQGKPELPLDQVSGLLARKVSEIRLADMSESFREKLSDVLPRAVSEVLGIPYDKLKEIA